MAPHLGAKVPLARLTVRVKRTLKKHSFTKYLTLTARTIHRQTELFYGGRTRKKCKNGIQTGKKAIKRNITKLIGIKR
jgi:hypothetical protein